MCLVHVSLFLCPLLALSPSLDLVLFLDLCCVITVLATSREICPKRLANGQPRPEMVLVWYDTGLQCLI